MVIIITLLQFAFDIALDCDVKCLKLYSTNSAHKVHINDVIQLSFVTSDSKKGSALPCNCFHPERNKLLLKVVLKGDFSDITQKESRKKVFLESFKELNKTTYENNKIE